MKKKILFFSGKRGGINHFIPLIKLINKNKKLKTSILFTDMHISKIFGETFKEFKYLTKDIHLVKSIENKFDGSKINRAKQVPKAMDKIIFKLNKIKPYCVVILGDRSELFSVAIPCMILNIPIVHFYGGDISEGSTDNVTRFSLSMLSNIHLVSNNYSYKKLIKIGIEKKKIYNTGLLSLHQIPKKKISKKHVFNKLSLNIYKKTIIIIFHPETYFLKNLKLQINTVLTSLKKIDANKIFIYPCSDPGYDIIIDQVEKFCLKNKDSSFYKNLNNELFYSLYSKSDLIIGNSSSGILESGFMRVPAINIGNRQKGRIQTKNILNAQYNSEQIVNLIKYSLNNKKFKKKVKNLKSIYYKKNSINRCYEILSKINMANPEIIVNKF
ncbi:UDP-N-acetylglucosamine 2-epimerase [Candidatus Pelagibacter sp.]|nr:UDP-N-acetylglucosamine 2-epimerase [Candidatus Pelagibacter sp.]